LPGPVSSDLTIVRTRKKAPATRAPRRTGCTAGGGSISMESVDLTTTSTRYLSPLQRRVTYRDGFPVMWGRFPALGHFPAHALAALPFERLAGREVGPFFWNDMGFGNWMLTCLLPEAFEVFRHPASEMSFLREQLPHFYGEAINPLDGQEHRR